MPDLQFYSTANSILARCTNPKRSSYKFYGGRGIKVYKPWIGKPTEIAMYLEYVWEEQFGHTDFSNYGPGKDQYSVDRILNNGHYVPGNIRFATRSEQAKNRRQYCGITNT